MNIMTLRMGDVLTHKVNGKDQKCIYYGITLDTGDSVMLEYIYVKDEHLYVSHGYADQFEPTGEHEEAFVDFVKRLYAVCDPLPDSEAEAALESRAVGFKDEQ